MVDKGILIPAVLSIALFGAFALRRSFGDVLIMFIFGLIGYIMVREKYSIISFILGLILGTTAEGTLWRSLQSGGWWIFLERPQSVTLLVLLVIIMVVAFTNIKRYLFNLIPI
jgi:putative tricarboxylic transport membrane protein